MNCNSRFSIQSKFTLNLKTATTSGGPHRRTKDPRICAYLASMSPSDSRFVGIPFIFDVSHTFHLVIGVLVIFHIAYTFHLVIVVFGLYLV